MALGAITRPSNVQDGVWGNKKIRTREIVLGTGANYPTGGETITASLVGLKKIEQVLTTSAVKATSGGATARTIAIDYTAIAGNYGAVKMQVYTTASAEAANNSDQSAFTARLTFIGN